MNKNKHKRKQLHELVGETLTVRAVRVGWRHDVGACVLADVETQSHKNVTVFTNITSLSAHELLKILHDNSIPAVVVVTFDLFGTLTLQRII